MSKTVADRVRWEPDPIKGSRHIATVVPIESADELAEILAGCRAEFPGACHHAWALRSGPVIRCSDDGEPSGSAGRPILARVDGAGLDDVVVVVSRIFGGTKLGVGGLVRAYGGAAGEALDRATIIERIPQVSATVQVGYGHQERVGRVLAEHEAVIADTDWGVDVRHSVTVPAPNWDALQAALADATNGAAQVREVE